MIHRRRGGGAVQCVAGERDEEPEWRGSTVQQSKSRCNDNGKKGKAKMLMAKRMKNDEDSKKLVSSWYMSVCLWWTCRATERETCKCMRVWRFDSRCEPEPIVNARSSVRVVTKDMDEIRSSAQPTATPNGRMPAHVSHHPSSSSSSFPCSNVAFTISTLRCVDSQTSLSPPRDCCNSKGPVHSKTHL